MINDLKEFIEIYSIKSEPEKNAPFGKKLRTALDLFLSKAKEYGLATGEDAGYYGWAEYGEGKLIGVLAHLDVVPAGSGWSADPTTLTLKNGNMYGRGVIDDKGGLVAALHALKQLSEEKVKLGCRVRLIAGCDEESGCECLKRYAKNGEIPLASFTPDAEFPVINSEKGIAHIKVSFPKEKSLSENFEYISGGERVNVVPQEASCKIIGKLSGGFPQTKDIFVSTAKSGGVIVTTKGTAAHGSTPEKGDNAIIKLLRFLDKTINSPAIHFAAETLAANNAAKLFGIDVSDGKSGRLTYNAGMISLNEGVLSLSIDIRKPVSLPFDELISRIKNKLPTGCCLEILSKADNLYISENDKLIKTLLSVYEKHSGKKEKPLQIGGGTYAKTLPNCVAFGPAVDGTDYHMHDANEFLPVEWFYKLKEIYYDAIVALSKII